MAPDTHDLQTLTISPRALGDLVGRVGTPDFVRSLGQFVTGDIQADAIHLERLRPDARSPSGYTTEWIGSTGEEYALICEIMDRYYASYCDRDPLFVSIRGSTGKLLIQRDVGALTDDGLRREIFMPARIAQECVISHGTRNERYSLGLARCEGRAAFSLRELAVLQQMGEFLFPLCEMHSRTASARRISTPRREGTPVSRFEERIAREEIRLSRREGEICRSLLSGKTIPESAQMLELKLSTAESYVKRAFAKLNVRTKWELLQWAHSSE
ncbi:LuxR family transcriptional regulator [Paraburkholderia sp. Ac-20340]|uniref:helix-turn-helix transcriptional regulator n=1 Tax=Paraburkholderia sp. Ac-20340 TaxID=2703888 RepID=UPI00197EB780|nr:helix-turn-helix transcriptional regulator [Paraburkholderia sp. Ac-20340]MBN3852172.1 LuxR family transcriptional regulator [Paraburkholderia sp. Ac-20340]